MPSVSDIDSDPIGRAAFRLVTAGSAGVIVLTLAYLVIPLTRGLAAACAVMAVALWLVLRREDRRRRDTGAGGADAADDMGDEERSRARAGTALLCVGALADAALVALFSAARTDQAIVSPWTRFSWEPFVLFALSTALVFFGSRLRGGRAGLAAAAWHAFAAVSVSATAYGIGFGFDPFLHRAAEEELAGNGAIEPRQILYAGQYVSVAALHLLTAIPVRLIDIWSVPVLASLAWPISGYLGLRYGWGLDDRDARSWWIAAFAQPFMLATFTVPFSWTYVWFVAVLFLLPTVARSARAFAALVLGSAAFCLFHPLLAVPTLVLVVGFRVWSRAPTRMFRGLALVALALAVAVGVPALFATYQWRQGVPVDVSSLWTHAGSFVALFRSPYWDPYPYIPWFLQAIYALRYWLPVAMMAVGTILLVWTARSRPIVPPYLAFVVGLLGAIYGTATLFSFRGVIDHEQLEFALRLLTAWYLIPLPVLAVAASTLASRRPRAALVVALAACALVVHSWYFSYPQYNLKYPFLSPSVGADDVAAVRLIDADAAGRPHVVLSNQMTSAAAIQEFRFRSYVDIDGEQALWYAIPTGGPLYAYYSRAIYSGPTRALFDELRARSPVARIYFVVHDYWPWEPGFLEELSRGADGELTVRDGSVRIFIFTYE